MEGRRGRRETTDSLRCCVSDLSVKWQVSLIRAKCDEIETIQLAEVELRCNDSQSDDDPSRTDDDLDSLSSPTCSASLSLSSPTIMCPPIELGLPFRGSLFSSRKNGQVVLVNERDAFTLESFGPSGQGCQVCTLPRSNSPRAEAAICSVGPDCVVVCGGKDTSAAVGGCRATCELFDWKSKIWRSLPCLKEQRRQAKAIAVETAEGFNVFVFGGINSMSRSGVRSVEKLRGRLVGDGDGKLTFSDGWEIVSQWKNVRSDFTLVKDLSERRVVIVGGKNQLGRKLQCVCVFDTISQSWPKSHVELAVPRSEPVCLMCPDEETMVVLGGANSGTALNVGELVKLRSLRKSACCDDISKTNSEEKEIGVFLSNVKSLNPLPWYLINALSLSNAWLPIAGPDVPKGFCVVSNKPASGIPSEAPMEGCPSIPPGLVAHAHTPTASFSSAQESAINSPRTFVKTQKAKLGFQVSGSSVEKQCGGLPGFKSAMSDGSDEWTFGRSVTDDPPHASLEGLGHQESANATTERTHQRHTKSRESVITAELPDFDFRNPHMRKLMRKAVLQTRAERQTAENCEMREKTEKRKKELAEKRETTEKRKVELAEKRKRELSEKRRREMAEAREKRKREKAEKMEPGEKLLRSDNCKSESELSNVRPFSFSVSPPSDSSSCRIVTTDSTAAPSIMPCSGSPMGMSPSPFFPLVRPSRSSGSPRVSSPFMEAEQDPPSKYRNVNSPFGALLVVPDDPKKHTLLPLNSPTWSLPSENGVSHFELDSIPETSSQDGAKLLHSANGGCCCCLSDNLETCCGKGDMTEFFATRDFLPDLDRSLQGRHQLDDAPSIRSTFSNSPLESPLMPRRTPGSSSASLKDIVHTTIAFETYPFSDELKKGGELVLDQFGSNEGVTKSSRKRKSPDEMITEQLPPVSMGRKHALVPRIDLSKLRDVASDLRNRDVGSKYESKDNVQFKNLILSSFDHEDESVFSPQDTQRQSDAAADESHESSCSNGDGDGESNVTAGLGSIDLDEVRSMPVDELMDRAYCAIEFLDRYIAFHYGAGRGGRDGLSTRGDGDRRRGDGGRRRDDRPAALPTVPVESVQSSKVEWPFAKVASESLKENLLKKFLLESRFRGFTNPSSESSTAHRGRGRGLDPIDWLSMN